MYQDKPRDKCGVFGIYIHPKDNELFKKVLRYSGIHPNINSLASAVTVLCLHDLQHRGQESAGIATYNGNNPHLYKKMGKVLEIFDPNKISNLPGNIAIGHTRYSTHGPSNEKNSQPLEKEINDSKAYIAHNGNYTNATQLKKELEGRGAVFQTDVDTEVALHLLNETDPSKSLVERVTETYEKIEGANTSLLLTKEGIIGYRDPKGYRPLVMAQVGKSYILSSEDGGILRNVVDAINAEVRFSEISPGEIVEIINGKMNKRIVHRSDKLSQCIFELVYMARPDATIFGIPVAQFRIEIGKQLAREHKIKADYVIPTLDSGVLVATGYSMESGIPLLPAGLRDHYYGRSFIDPNNRGLIARRKQIQLRNLIKGKILIRIDDSQVRNTTAKDISEKDQKYGVLETHWIFGFPPVKYPCFWGTDFPEKEELIAADRSKEEIIKLLGPVVKSLNHLSLEGLMEVIEKFKPGASNDFDYHCITGKK